MKLSTPPSDNANDPGWTDRTVILWRKRVIEAVAMWDLTGFLT